MKITHAIDVHRVATIANEVDTIAKGVDNDKDKGEEEEKEDNDDKEEEDNNNKEDNDIKEEEEALRTKRRPEGPKGGQKGQRRPEGPHTRSWGPEGPLTFIQDNS